MPSPVHDDALAYARRGWRLVPVHIPTPGGCSCGSSVCPSPGKHPRIPAWTTAATTHLETIDQWWRQWPEANIGLATGHGLVDIETEAYGDGDSHLTALESQLGALPDTVSWISGGGGVHRLFACPADRRIPNATNLGAEILGVLRTAIDVRGDGGQAILPPSRHASGGVYRWGTLHPDAIPVAELPPAWVDFLTADPTASRLSAGGVSAGGDGNRIPAGQRNHTLARLAGAMRRVGMTDSEVRAALTQVNQDRCSPPVAPSEVDAIAASVCRYAPDQVATAVAEGHWAQDHTGSPDALGGSQPLPPALDLTDLLAYTVADDPHTLLGDRWLCRGGACVVVGQTGIGKSSFTLQAAITWGLGESLFGIRPRRPLRSLIVQAENDVGDLAEMAGGVVAGLRCALRVPELAGHLAIVSDTSRSGEAFLAAMRGLIARHQPDLVWVDPLFAFLGGNASDQAVVSPFLRTGLGAIAQETGVAWMLVHHTNKPARDGSPAAAAAQDYAYLGSGSAEIANWARAVLVLRPVNDQLFELRAAKRGRRAGLVDGAGTRSTEIFLRQAAAGICWERAHTGDQDQRTEDQAQADAIVAALDRTRAYRTTELRDAVAQTLGVSRSAVYTDGRRANRIYRQVLALVAKIPFPTTDIISDVT